MLVVNLGIAESVNTILSFCQFPQCKLTAGTRNNFLKKNKEKPWKKRQCNYFQKLSVNNTRNSSKTDSSMDRCNR